MKAIKPSLARTVTSPTKATSSSRLMSPSAISRTFHSTPQDAAYTRPTMTAREHGYTTQFFTSPPPKKPSTASQHPYDARKYSSGAAPRRPQQQQKGSPFDEDVIEELRPMVANKTRSTGSGKKAGGMRAMNTGKGEEWVW